MSRLHLLRCFYVYFFFNDTATTEIYTLSLHDARPISPIPPRATTRSAPSGVGGGAPSAPGADRKSTRLNSSHDQISYAVFCLKKKKKKNLISTLIKKKNNTRTN